MGGLSSDPQRVMEGVLMPTKHPIVAVDTDSHDDAGFTIQFDRVYNITEERLPVTADAAVRAIEDAWEWGYDPRRLDEREQVGVLVTDGRHYTETRCTR